MIPECQCADAAIDPENRESRRSNAELRPPKDNDAKLHTIYRDNGEVSASFPRTLGDLFRMDGKNMRAKDICND